MKSLSLSSQENVHHLQIRVPHRLVFLLVILCLIDFISCVRIEGLQRRSLKPAKQCKIYKKAALYEFVDRICILCHEMFSHHRPDMRAECRSNCFKNEHFKNCLSVFSPPATMENMVDDSKL